MISDIFCLPALCSHYISSSCICPWFTRVASESNPGDDPSRGQSQRMAALIRARHDGPLEASESLASSILTVESFFDLWKSLRGHLNECSLVKMGVVVQFAVVRQSPSKCTQQQWMSDKVAQFPVSLPMA